MTRRITWTCDICQQPIADHDGYLYCLDRRAHSRWSANQNEIATEVLDHWVICHRACDPRPEVDGLVIHVERWRTRRDDQEWRKYFDTTRWMQWTDLHRLLWIVHDQMGPK